MRSPMTQNRRPPARMILALALVLVASTSDALYRDGSLWPRSSGGITPVSVCFRLSGDYTSDEEAALRRLVREAIGATWGRWTKIQFSGFGTCGTPIPNATLAIKLTKYDADGVESVGGAGDVPDQTIHTSGHRGFQRPGTPLCGGWPTSPWSGWTTAQCGWMQIDVDHRRAWAVVTHEIGHALAFEHEQSRPDAVDACPDGNEILDGTIVTPEYDDVSTMSYCVPLGAGRLSLLDIRGAQRLYGTSPAGSWLKALPALAYIPVL